ncbi:uncharacterized protein YciI [Pacificibacter maritimus]|uniref:Uncharacterized protein YciI n=1 Tax=Pacificibacter maritimus TaxID=762213 RepID=A0A3N4USS1_9RHOB|nr:YciI family protein [Pacificibacter maritimus]RPE71755.1 uncharacterized protein YciI [Pacificibacter maritimus]
MSIVAADQTLFHIDITYVVDLELIDGYMSAHMDYLGEGYARGFFLASGPKVPRTGAVILATASERSVLEAFLQRDPLVQHGLTTMTVVEFKPCHTVDGL